MTHAATLPRRTASGSLAPLGAGRYLIEEELGRGGMGRVHRAWDPLLLRPVALKLANPRLAGSWSSGQARLLHEAQAAARVAHESVVRVLDAGVELGRVYLVMDLVQGQTLTEWLGTPRTPAEVLRIGLALARALEAIHAAGVVHRDVKPDNVLIDPRGRPVLVDFGLATSPGAALPEGPGPRGTLEYMSPEQARGEAGGPHGDVWGLGAVLYRALAGGPPHEAETGWSLLAKLATEPAPPLASRVKLPAAIAGLVDRCLARDPGARPSAGELGLELERLLAPIGLTARVRSWLRSWTRPRSTRARGA